jgi:hypothetical protein
MIIKPKVLLLALPFFLVFALVPVVNLGDKGWAPVWIAYPAFFGLLLEWLSHLFDDVPASFVPQYKTFLFAGISAVIIAVHLSLSLGIATLIDKRFFRTKS